MNEAVLVFLTIIRVFATPDGNQVAHMTVFPDPVSVELCEAMREDVSQKLDLELNKTYDRYTFKGYVVSCEEEDPRDR